MYDFGLLNDELKSECALIYFCGLIALPIFAATLKPDS